MKNLRDHMTNIELILTMLAEATTTKQLQQGLAQLGEEGAIQVFSVEIHRRKASGGMTS